MLKRLGISIVTTLLITPVFAATTGSLTLQGTVAEQLAITVTPSDGTPGDGTFSGIDLHTTNNVGLNVGSVNESSNSNTGYAVNVTYDGVMSNSVNNSTPFSYTLFYGGVEVSKGAADEVTNNAAGVYDENKALTITYTGVAAEDLVAGLYEDVIQFEIVAN